MSGQSITDRITAAQHSVTGSAISKTVCKATTHEIMGPKKKHLDCKYWFFKLLTWVRIWVWFRVPYVSVLMPGLGLWGLQIHVTLARRGLSAYENNIRFSPPCTVMAQAEIVCFTCHAGSLDGRNAALCPLHSVWVAVSCFFKARVTSL